MDKEMSREDYEKQKHEYMHPKLLAKFKKQAPDLLEERMTPASEENERRFWDQVKKSKKPVKREITHLYRTKIELPCYFCKVHI